MNNIFLKYLWPVLLLSFNNCYSQKLSFVVTKLNDTIYVEYFKIKADNIKVKINGENKKFTYEEIKSLYDFKKKKHFQKIEPAFVEYSKNSGTTFFAELLTDGKVKIYNAIINHSLGYGRNFINDNQYSSFYIGIYDDKPELICHEWNLRLTKEVYQILKLYLHSNESIQKKLDDLFFSKEEEENKEKKIISLVDEYNDWAAAKK